MPGGVASFSRIFPAVLLLLLTVLAYSSVLSAGFIWDDDAYVTDNIHLRTAEGLAAIWLEPGATPQYYPLVFTLFWVQFKLWGLAPLGYHVVNVALHGANAVLLWQILKKLNVPVPFWIAALFALHPVHVESVAWITELKNVLSTFFALISFLLYWRFNEVLLSQRLTQRDCCLYTGALITFLLALFSKSVVGSLPAVILLLIWWKQERISRIDVLRLVPFFALALLAGWNTARLEVSHVYASGAEWDFSFVERVLIAGRAIWFYAAKLFWPYPLIFNYERWQIDATLWWQYLFPLGVVAVAAALWLLRGKIGRGALAGYLFFVGSLFPALGFINVYPMRFSYVADHFQYVASIGLMALFAGTAWHLVEKFPRFHAAAWCSAASVILLLAALTWQQGRIYHSRLTLFSDTIKKNPASWLSYGNRGLYYANEGRFELAMIDLNKTLELKPDEADALHNRGRLYYERKNFDKALADFDRAIQIHPWRSDYYKNRIIVYRETGRLDKAIADADRVIFVYPGHAENYLLRASIYALQEELAKALDDLNIAARITPDDFQIYANRGLIYYRQGLLADAVRDFDTALRLDPGSAATHFNRGLARAAGGDVFAARSDLLRARELGYELDDAEFGLILSRKGTGSRGK